MNIETKYGLGAEVWFMCDNKPVSDQVSGISIDIDGYRNTNVVYRFDYRNKQYFEGDLFKTKDELMKSL